MIREIVEDGNQLTVPPYTAFRGAASSEELGEAQHPGETVVQGPGTLITSPRLMPSRKHQVMRLLMKQRPSGTRPSPTGPTGIFAALRHQLFLLELILLLRHHRFLSMCSGKVSGLVYG